jgi:hypothetical protein
LVIDEEARQPPEFGPRLGDRRLHGEQPRHDAFDIAVDHIGGAVKGDGRHRCGRIGAHAGQG